MGIKPPRLTLHALFSHDGRTKADPEKDRNPKVHSRNPYRGRRLLDPVIGGERPRRLAHFFRDNGEFVGPEAVAGKDGFE